VERVHKIVFGKNSWIGNRGTAAKKNRTGEKKNTARYRVVVFSKREGHRKMGPTVKGPEEAANSKIKNEEHKGSTRGNHKYTGGESERIVTGDTGRISERPTILEGFTTSSGTEGVGQMARTKTLPFSATREVNEHSPSQTSEQILLAYQSNQRMVSRGGY